jgi:ABC-type branched-subunit amino acid transport system substrate-binding protein
MSDGAASRPAGWQITSRRRIGHVVVPVAVAAVLAVAVAACGSSSSSSSSGSSPTSSSGASSAASKSSGFALRIGDLLPFTGDLSAFGPSLDAANHLAATYINQQLAADGLSKRYSVKIVDSQDEDGSAEQAAEGATKLADVDNVNVIDGPLNSGSMVAVAQSVTLPHGLIEVSPTASASEISKLPGHLLFSMNPSNTFVSRELVAAVQQELGAHATVNVGWSEDASDIQIGSTFAQLWTQAGGKIGKSLSWDPDASTFDTEAGELVSGHPSGVVLCVFPTTYQKLGPALVRTGAWSPAKTFMTPELRDPTVISQLGSKLTEGLRGVSPALGETPLQKSFTALFTREEPGKTPTGYEPYAFDSVVVTFLAALEAGSTDGHAIAGHMQSVTSPPGHVYTYQNLAAAIKAALAGQKINYDGVSGPLDLGTDGTPTQGSFDMWGVSNGKLVTLKTFTSLP